MRQGVLRSPNLKEAHAKFQAFRKTIPILPFSLTCAKRCAMLREQLKHEGKRVKARALDLINAAMALEHDLSRVTRNVEDYQDISGLHIETGILNRYKERRLLMRSPSVWWFSNFR